MKIWATGLAALAVVSPATRAAVAQDALPDDQATMTLARPRAIARAIADGAARPRWNEGDFFGLRYNGYGAK